MADNLLQEVDAALRADRAASLWQTYKPIIIAVAVALVLGTAAKSGWQAYREHRGGETLTKLSDAKNLIVQGKAADAAKQFASIAQEESGELKALALVWQSRAEMTAGNKQGAVNALTEATMTGTSLWSDLACLRLAGLDTAAAKPCLSAKTKSPLAEERAQWAAAAAWEAGDSASARASLEALMANEATSPERREQLAQWLAVMTPAAEH